MFICNEEIHWVRTDLTLKNGESLSVLARIRYRQKLEKAIIYKVEAGLYVEFEQEDKYGRLLANVYCLNEKTNDYDICLSQYLLDNNIIFIHLFCKFWQIS